MQTTLKYGYIQNINLTADKELKILLCMERFPISLYIWAISNGPFLALRALGNRRETQNDYSRRTAFGQFPIELKLYSPVSQTWRSSVDPVIIIPFHGLVKRTSVSANPDRFLLYLAVRITHYELLKHVVDVLICDDRQRW